MEAKAGNGTPRMNGRRKAGALPAELHAHSGTNTHSKALPDFLPVSIHVFWPGPCRDRAR